MNSGATADRVYDALKARLLSAEVRPGERLDPALIAHDLISSVTPVRDALHRLVGERLVETRSGTGFHFPPLHEADLRDLLIWNRQILIMATRSSPERKPPEPSIGGDRIERTRLLFREMGRLSRNGEIMAVIEGNSDRLGLTRVIEANILDALDEELSELDIALRGAATEGARAIRAYHRRRLAVVPALVRACYDTH